MANKDLEITKQTMMLKLMADVFGSDAKTVAQVLKSVSNEQSDALIDLVMDSQNQESLNNAVDLFNEAKSNLNL